MRSLDDVMNPPGLMQIISKEVERRVITDAIGQRFVVTLLGERYGDSYRVTNVISRPFEVRPGDFGHFRGRIMSVQPLNGQNGSPPRLGYSVEFQGVHDAQVMWQPEESMIVLEEQPDLPDEPDGLPGGAYGRMGFRPGSPSRSGRTRCARGCRSTATRSPRTRSVRFSARWRRRSAQRLATAKAILDAGRPAQGADMTDTTDHSNKPPSPRRGLATYVHGTA
jgi:hypothetical protein